MKDSLTLTFVHFMSTFYLNLTVCVTPPLNYSAGLNFAKHVVVCHDGLHDRI